MQKISKDSSKQWPNFNIQQLLDKCCLGLKCLLFAKNIMQSHSPMKKEFDTITIFSM